MLTSDAAVAAVAHGMGVEAAVLALGIVIHIISQFAGDI